MSGYIIVQINITNKESYKEYLKNVTTIAEKYGGEYLVRGGNYESLLGNWDYERTVVIKFPTYKIAYEWYNSKALEASELSFWYRDSNSNPNSPSSWYNDPNRLLDPSNTWYFEFGRNGLSVPTG